MEKLEVNNTNEQVSNFNWSLEQILEYFETFPERLVSEYNNISSKELLEYSKSLKPNSIQDLYNYNVSEIDVLLNIFHIFEYTWEINKGHNEDHYSEEWFEEVVSYINNFKNTLRRQKEELKKKSELGEALSSS